MKLLSQGAEAKIFLEDGRIIKERVSKSYRHPELDLKIRKRTTRFESRLLERAAKLIPVPKILKNCDKKMEIEMEFLDGKKLRDAVDSMTPKERDEVFTTVGKQIAKIHNADIIHGDLTTSNMILHKGKVYFIDFGLGFISPKVEDKAVDLHLLKQALESKHYKHFEECYNAAMKGYESESNDFKKLNERLKKVEGRGRYKARQ